MNSQAHEKYLHDPIFHNLVDALQSVIAANELTPSEVRQAVMYACCLHEERTIRPFLVPKTSWFVMDKKEFDRENQ